MFQLQTIWQFSQRMPERDTSSSKVQHREDKITKHKGCPHLYKCDTEEEEDEEEFMATMCHSGET